MTKDDIAKVIATLELVRQRPAMFMGRVSGTPAELFLSGVAAVCHALGTRISFEVREQAATERGWPFPPYGPAVEMRERGFTEEQVVDELIAIEIRALEILAAQANSE